jgi:hypothetical protein
MEIYKYTETIIIIIKDEKRCQIGKENIFLFNCLPSYRLVETRFAIWWIKSFFIFFFRRICLFRLTVVFVCVFWTEQIIQSQNLFKHYLRFFYEFMNGSTKINTVCLKCSMHPKYSVGSFHRMKNDFLKFMVKFELTEFFSFVQSKKPKFYQKSDSILIGRLYRFIYGRENCGRE